ncbi:hypothetical protein QIG60_25200, partial [Klebsiella pneumoniae]|nr:hypothetical protein [Klebsiella pneumoniae]
SSQLQGRSHEILFIQQSRGALQTVGQGLIDHGPVNVPIPVLIGPSWNGSGSGYNSATSSSGSGS